MSIDRVTPGELIKFDAAEENRRRDLVNGVMQTTGVDSAVFGSNGKSMLQGFAAPHAIYELKWTCNNGTCYVVWDPDDDDAPVPPGLATVPDVPYTLEARRIWLDHAANTYGQASISPDEVIYFPMALDEDDVGGYGDGDRIPAWYDEQSGRWWSLNNPGTLSSSSSGEGQPSSSSSSSSGEEESSSSSSGEESSSSSSSSGEEACAGVTETFELGGKIVLVGTSIEQRVWELEFVDGILCEKTETTKVAINICDIICP